MEQSMEKRVESETHPWIGTANRFFSSSGFISDGASRHEGNLETNLGIACNALRRAGDWPRLEENARKSGDATRMWNGTKSSQDDEGP